MSWRDVLVERLKERNHRETASYESFVQLSKNQLNLIPIQI